MKLHLIFARFEAFKAKILIRYILKMSMSLETESHLKVAVITGVAGQDGTQLLDFLVEKGYFVVGLTRRFIKPLPHHGNSCTYFNGSITDFETVKSLVSFALNILSPSSKQPIELYHLAALSHVRESFNNPTSTIDTNVSGTTNVLEAVRTSLDPKRFRVYIAGSAEMYGNAVDSPQKETTKFNPYSPYGVSKVLGFELARFYRQSFSLFVCNGILFNHESTVRPKTFVTRKITSYVALFSEKYAAGKNEIAPLQLGSLGVTRDWGWSKDYVNAMWLMLQKGGPIDLVIASGVSTSVREFVSYAFSCIGITLSWEGIGLNEKAYIAGTRTIVVEVNKDFYRPADGSRLVGNPTRAREELGWVASTSVLQIIESMVQNDINELGSMRKTSSEHCK